MRKKLSVSLFLLLSAGIAVARPVSVEEAMQTAYGFYQKQAGRSGVSADFELKLAYTGGCPVSGTLLAAASAAPAYYVFEKPANSGFIIVSGESETADILGYSDNGPFEYENIPDNFRAWLDACGAAVAGVRSGAGYGAVESKPLQAGEYAASVEPLLGDIMWDQSSPYNLLCPKDPEKGGHCVTGCVATAMAQIMRYHKWPVKGKGTNSYTTETLGINMSVSFSKSVYDWDNMTGIYNENSTDAEKQAVALLMRDCGVGVSMDYTSYASGAQSSDVGKALVTYFSYDENLQIYDREYFTEDVWLDMLRKELNARRPVYYSGSSLGGGHAFVCDGYDTNGLFHFNWGWSGLSNGYFDVTILDPSSQGIGAGSGGYSFQQYIITGIQKPSGESNQVELMCLSSPVVTDATQVSKGETFNIRFGIRNRGLQELMPRFGFGLYKDEELQTVLNSTEFSVGLPYNFGKDDISLDVSVPSSTDDGIYRIYPIYRNRNVGDWKIMNGKIGCQSYLDLDVQGDVVKISSSSPSFSLSVDSIQLSSLYKGYSAKLTMNIKNDGDADYVGTFMINLKNNDNAYTVLAEGLDIKAGETYRFDKTFSVNVPLGEYMLIMYYDEKRDAYMYPLTGVNVEVEELAQSGKLELLEDVSLDSNELYAGDELGVNVNVRTVGGPFFSKVIAYVYNSGSYSEPVQSFGENLFMSADGDSCSVKLASVVNLSPGSYRVDVWSYIDSEFVKLEGGTTSCVFKVLASGVEDNAAGLSVYVDGASDMLVIDGEDHVESVAVYSVSGAVCRMERVSGSGRVSVPLSSLAAGTYVVKVKTADGCVVRKFVKD